MLYVVDVAVALARPPGEHRWSRYILDAETPVQAIIDALHWASCPRLAPGATRKPNRLMAEPVMPVAHIYRGRYTSQPDPAEVATLAAEMAATVARHRASERPEGKPKCRL